MGPALVLVLVLLSPLLVDHRRRGGGVLVVGALRLSEEREGEELRRDAERGRQELQGQKNYIKINHGNCRELGFFPILDQSTCEDAAARLGLADRDAKETEQEDVPEGCYYFENHDLMLSTNCRTKGHGAEMSTHHSPRHPICQSEPFDCREDLLRYRFDWSPEKIEWCCGHFGLGCEAPAYQTGDIVQLLQRNGQWSPCKVTGTSADGCVDVFVPQFKTNRRVQPAMVGTMLRKAAAVPSSAPAPPSVEPVYEPAPWHFHPDLTPMPRPRVPIQ
eukprot:TRINITY_DN36083_c0_g1_i1.p1 TRINITY_DN36083_c0_g1~~TRINITY_DN36083_c0_g1_i1.p1  ORF type:complete len:275 (+),score=50.26 TRINITY_DN36083_c0_g1_i1:130-954(+)